MGKKSTPAAPDYTGAAEATAESSRELATANTTANRPTQITPWGTSSWASSAGRDPSTGLPVTNWTQNLELSGQQQEALDSQMAVQAGRSDLAEGLIGRAGAELQNPMDWNGMPAPAGTPEVPDFYGQNLPSMGTAPNAAAYGQNQFDYQGNYDRLQQYNQGPQQSQYESPNQSNLNQWGQGGERSQYEGAPDRSQFEQWGQTPDSSQFTDYGQGPQSQRYQREGAQLEFDATKTQAQEQQFQQELRKPTQELDANGGFQQRFADQQFERQMSLMAPQHNQAKSELENRLRNMGMNPGDASYDQQVQNLRTQQGEEVNRLTADSVRFGTDQQQAAFGRQFQTRGQQQAEASQQGNFSNAASQMRGNQQMQLQDLQYQQAQGRGQFANQARSQRSQEQLAMGGQEFDQGLRSAQYQDAQRQQQLNEGLNLSNYKNSLRGQQSNEALGYADYNNNLQDRQFDQSMANSQYTDAQRGQQFNENQTSADYRNSLRDRQFNQGIQQGNYQNAMRGQQFGELNQLQEQTGAAAQSQFDREMSAAQYQDAQRRQLSQEQLAMGGQGFSQQMQAANYQNTLRQQAITEEMQRRGMSINEMNALLSGQQVGMPGMPDFNQATMGQATDYLGAANMQGNFDQQSFGTNAGMFNAALGMAGSIGGGLAMPGS
mgnify:CR=1 FL=1